MTFTDCWSGNDFVTESQPLTPMLATSRCQYAAANCTSWDSVSRDWVSVVVLK